MMLYIFTKFHENILNGFKVISGHNLSRTDKQIDTQSNTDRQAKTQLLENKMSPPWWWVGCIITCFHGYSTDYLVF